MSWGRVWGPGNGDPGPDSSSHYKAVRPWMSRLAFKASASCVPITGSELELMSYSSLPGAHQIMGLRIATQ